MSRPTKDPARAPGLPAWLVDPLPGLLLLGIALRTLGPVHDPDTWWHIRSGAQLARTWTFVGPDPWHTFATRTWIRHEWLLDLAFGSANRIGGLPAVAWLLPAMTVAVAGALYAVVRSRAGVLVSTVVTAAALLSMAGSLSLRPQVVSFGFAAVAAGAWLDSARDLRPRWWLLPLTWVWACCHGFWVLSPLIGLLVAGVGVLVPDHPPERRQRLRLVAVALASLAVGAATPVGPRLLLAPFQVSTITAYVQEWQRSPVTDPPFLAGLVLTVGAGLWVARRPKERVVPLVLVLLAIGLVIESRRTVGLGAAVVAPVAADALQRLMPSRRERGGALQTRLAIAGGAVGLILTAALAPAVAASPQGVPTGLSPTLDALPAGTVVCNAYDVGSWLLFAHPGLRPVIDGRTELYAAADVRAYLTFASGSPHWSAYAARMGCTAALLPSDSAIARAVAADPAWTATGEAQGWSLYTSP